MRDYEEMLVVDGSLVLLGKHALGVQQLVQHQVLAVDLAHLRGQWHGGVVVLVSTKD